jgi:hypothetical protein
VAVNLTDSATIEDLTSPEGVAAFERFYAGYQQRSRLAGSFKALHVVYRDGAFSSPDFGLASDTLDSLVRECERVLLALTPDDPLPNQSRESWWDFWRFPLRKFFVAYPFQTHRRKVAFVSVKGDAWL